MSEGWHSAGSSHDSTGEDRFAEKEDVTPAGSHFLRTAYKSRCLSVSMLSWFQYYCLCFQFATFYSSQRFNILQESLIKLVEACNDQSHNMDRWLSKLEASNWLTHIKEILTAACLAAQCIDR